MRRKRKQAAVIEREIEHDERSPLFCSWTSRTHAACHKLAESGLPFCLYHVAAAHGMARGASTPDEKSRALFEQVWNAYDDDEVDE
jgi:hypothetical protein